MTRPLELPNLADLAELHVAGHPLKRLADDAGISRSALKRALLSAGYHVRGRGSDSVLLAFETMAPERRARIHADAVERLAAHRGHVRTEEQRMRAARSREGHTHWITADECRIADALSDRGRPPRVQPAIGRYNADLALGSVAVEVETFHAVSSHRQRSRLLQRLDYLLDRAHVVWIFHDPLCPLAPSTIADYLIAFTQTASPDPTPRGEYRMIWGDAKHISRGDHDLDELARVLPTRSASRLRPRD